MSIKKDTWAALLAEMVNASEQKCLTMLEKEAAGANRTLWKQRLYQRFSKLRRVREHKRYLKGKDATKVDNI